MSLEQNRKRWLALAVIVAAQFMVVLDVAIVNVALPSIKTDLHFNQENLQWVITAYSILFGGVLPADPLAHPLCPRPLSVSRAPSSTLSSLFSTLSPSPGSRFSLPAPCRP